MPWSARARYLLAAALATAALVSGARPAGAATQRASWDGVTATLGYRGAYVETRDMRLTISVDGITRYDEPVVSRWCGHLCQAATYTKGASALHVVNLGPGERRDVVVDLYSGGAHCCTIVQVLTYHERRESYAEAEREFGDPSATLADLDHDGRFEFLSADDTFAYAFTDYAASGLPVEVLAFNRGRFVDVTRRYPGLIRQDAERWLRAFTSQASQHYADTVGVVAAWAADEELLGHAVAVQHFLTAQAAAGHLNSALSPDEPHGRAFVTALERFLRARGYVARPS